MKPNNNFNLTHSLLQTVREVVAQEATMTGKKAMPKKKEPTVMISHGKGGGVCQSPGSQRRQVALSGVNVTRNAHTAQHHQRQQ